MGNIGQDHSVPRVARRDPRHREDTGTPITEDYQVPSKFTGTLEKVTINIAEQKLTEEELRQYREGRLKAALSQ